MGQHKSPVPTASQAIATLAWVALGCSIRVARPGLAISLGQEHGTDQWTVYLEKQGMASPHSWETYPSGKQPQTEWTPTGQNGRHG